MAEDISTKATDFVKKVLTVGVGAIFLTEESLRALISDFKLPKELLNTILEGANKTRKEFFQNFSEEVVNRVLDQMSPQELMEEFLHNNVVRMEVNLSFAPKSKALKKRRD